MKISIITINYNNKEGLRRTIESVVRQTSNEFEYIIVDGGSNDGSVDIIKEYTKQISYWISEKDNGIYNAMNKGVRHAQGEYCFFLNSGDYFYNENVLTNIATPFFKEDIIVGKVLGDNNQEISPHQNQTITFYQLYSGAIPHQGAFIKTSLLKDNPYDESLNICADWKFFIQTIIIKNCSFKYINDIISIYDTQGISSTNLILMRKEKERVLTELIPQRILCDYKVMKSSECMTSKLAPLIKKHYRIDKFMYTICFATISLIEKIFPKHS